jgi:hypothetical protein
MGRSRSALPSCPPLAPPPVCFAEINTHTHAPARANTVTLELLRKRSEHNNKELSTLEEISLHQQNLER